MAGSAGKIFKIIRHANCKLADVGSSLHEPERVTDLTGRECFDRSDGLNMALLEVLGALSQNSIKLS